MPLALLVSSVLDGAFCVMLSRPYAPLHPPLPSSLLQQTLGLTLMGSKTQGQWSDKEEAAFAAGVYPLWWGGSGLMKLRRHFLHSAV